MVIAGAALYVLNSMKLPVADGSACIHVSHAYVFIALEFLEGQRMM